MRKRRTTAVGLVLFLSLASMSFKSCDGGHGCADTDPRCNYAKASDALAGGIEAMIDAKRSLAAKKHITPEEELKLTELLTTANNAAIAFNGKVKSTTTLDDVTRTDLLSLLSNVTTAVDALNSSGVLRLGNDDARQKMARLFGTVSAAVNILVKLRTQPTATPTPAD